MGNSTDGTSVAAARRLVDRPHWLLSLYPDAGEAGGCLWAPPRRDGKEDAGPEPVFDLERAADEASRRAADEAGRRARAQVRRYCAANRLNRLGTLTYGGDGCHDPWRLRSDVGGFFRALRAGLGGEPLPYLWVGEPHPGGHGLHVHFAVGRYVKRSLIDRAWGLGFVHIKLLGNLPVACGALEEARLAARYLAKYASKSLGENRPAGLHRYEVAQGFQPRKIEIHGRSREDAIGQASAVMGRAPSEVWESPKEGWDGPPACWVAWSS